VPSTSMYPASSRAPSATIPTPILRRYSGRSG
jgi:hypothetical protein